VELIVLGAGPAYPERPGATGAAYLLQNGDDSLLLDLGQGSFPALYGRIEPSRLTGIVVSHLHPDHFIDLVALRHYLRWEFTPPRRVRIVAPAGLADRIDALHDEPGFSAQSFDVERIRVGEQDIGPFAVEAARVKHTAESYGFRVTLDGTPAASPGLVYSGDCGRADDLRPLIRPGDTLLAEASFGPGPVPEGASHLDGPAVGELAASSGAGRVLLTHLQMGFDRDATVASVRARYGGPVAFVDPGFETEI
jgi:ribonuclease BN (tRNA processing enzyme)